MGEHGPKMYFVKIGSYTPRRLFRPLIHSEFVPAQVAVRGP